MLCFLICLILSVTFLVLYLLPSFQIRGVSLKSIIPPWVLLLGFFVYLALSVVFLIEYRSREVTSYAPVDYKHYSKLLDLPEKHNDN